MSAASGFHKFCSNSINFRIYFIFSRILKVFPPKILIFILVSYISIGLLIYPELTPPTHRKLPEVDLSPYQVNGVILVLTQESRYEQFFTTLNQFERVFNRKYKYPYAILNDVHFSESYCNKVRALTDSEVIFIKIPKHIWSLPSHVDKTKMQDGMRKIHDADKNIPYWSSVTYRQMCRFMSGPLFTLEALRKFDYFWRLDDDVHYFCDFEYDPLRFLSEKKLLYGFSLSVREFIPTVASLYSSVLEFSQQSNHFNPEPWFHFFSKNVSQSSSQVAVDYNGCHFWTNMEMGSLNFFRGETYQAYFRFLDQKAGFFYERWGDAPVRSLGLGLFAKKSQVHLFHDISYMHTSQYRCNNQYSTCHCNILTLKSMGAIYDMDNDWPELVCNARFDSGYELPENMPSLKEKQ